MRRLEDQIDYDPESGVFRWKGPTTRRRIAGAVAGTTSGNGYRQIKVDGRIYLASRLAWYLTYGYWPKELDHINRIRADNRLSNLREVTRSQNRINTVPKCASGEKGIYWRGKKEMWEAVVHRDRRQHWVGSFHTIEEAKAARDRFLRARGE